MSWRVKKIEVGTLGIQKIWKEGCVSTTKENIATQKDIVLGGLFTRNAPLRDQKLLKEKDFLKQALVAKSLKVY